jgi:hypothetical protein
MFLDFGFVVGEAAEMLFKGFRILAAEEDVFP